MFAQGFAAVEAEFVVQLAKDAPANVTEWTAETARRFVKTMYIGIEIASSPLQNINDYGPAVVASDFGNNAGLLLGAEIADWQTRPLDIAELRNPHRRRGGRARWRSRRERRPADRPRLRACASMRAAAGRCVPGTSCPPGQPRVSTRSQAGQSAEAIFTGIGSLRCRTVPMTAHVPP